jgi:hypothetical protein
LSREELIERYKNVFVNTLTKGELSVDEKCKALEVLNRQLQKLFAGAQVDFSNFLADAIEASYAKVKQLFNEKDADEEGDTI